MFASHRLGMRTALRALIIALVIPMTALIATPAHAAGTISGTVTSAQGGAPLSNVEVGIYAANATQGDDPLYTANTNGSGFYSRAGLPNASYKVGFTDLDSVFESEFYSNATTVENGTNVVVNNGTANITVSLAPRGWIGGTVTNAVGGDPISDVDVILYQFYEDDVVSEWRDIAYLTADVDGTYRFYGPAGTYRVGFDGTGVGFSAEYYDEVADITNATDVQLVAGVGTESIDGTLDSRGSVSGQVTDTITGDPIEGIEVDFYADFETEPGQEPDWQLESSVETDADGQYSYFSSNPIRVGFEDPNETYAPEFYNNQIRVEDASTFDLSDGTAFPNSDAELALAGHITGTVTDPTDEGLFDIEVVIYRNEGTVPSPQWEEHATVYTDEIGDYEVPVGAGTYRVGFFGNFGSPVYYDAASSVETATDVVVAGSATMPNINAVVLSSDPELVATVKPKISGTPRVGSTLTASPGTWSPSGPTVTYSWLASGVPITGAHSASFKLTGAQVGKRITVLASASKAGSGDGSALSAATTAVMVKPTMKLTDKVKQRTVTLKVRLSAVGVTTVAGKVKIFRKSKLVETVKLKAGKVTVKLTKQPSGKAKYTAKYLGSGSVLAVKTTVKVAV